MSAAAITATSVFKKELVQDTISGTVERQTEYTIILTKVTQNDWVLLEGAIGKTTDTLRYMQATVVDSSGDGGPEVLAYTDADEKCVMSDTTVGTVTIVLRYKNA